jgi:hypothetical protein
MPSIAKRTRIILVILAILLVPVIIFRNRINFILHPPVKGAAIDSLNGVMVYYNGSVGNVHGRNTTEDGYNLGLQFQCVEFVKRYYYEYYRHKMPDSYGHAVSFYDPSLKDSSYSKKRDLMQYSNPGKSCPRAGDLLVYSGSTGNPYGHVAIVSDVTEGRIEIIQQNPGIGAPSRARFSLAHGNGKFSIGNDRILGWLRMRKK